MFFKFTIFVTCLVATAMGYSGGAPEAVCEDMTPKHPVEPQKSSMPYKVSVDKDAIKPTESVKITIGGDKVFKGFLLEVRDGDKPAGSFKIPSDDRYSKSINCGAGKSMGLLPFDDMFRNMVDSILHLFGITIRTGPKHKNAATHKNSADKKNLTLEWRAPRTGGQKKYTVYATVAENGGVYWVRKPTASIEVV